MTNEKRRRRFAPSSWVLSLALGCWASLSFSGCASDEKDTYEVPQDAASAADDAFDAGAQNAPSPKTLLTMARILTGQGKDDQALFVLMRIIREHPQYTPAYNELSELYLRQGKNDEALRTLELGMKLVPKDPVLQNNAGMVLLLKNEPKKAQEHFTRAAALVPEDARYRSNIATALAMQGEYDQALGVYELVLPPDEAHYNLGVVAESRNDTQRAEAEFALAEKIRKGGTDAIE